MRGERLILPPACTLTKKSLKLVLAVANVCCFGNPGFDVIPTNGDSRCDL
jgi:hypothetical protein